MNNPAASSGVSLGTIILFAASGGEFDPERLTFTIKIKYVGNYKKNMIIVSGLFAKLSKS